MARRKVRSQQPIILVAPGQQGAGFKSFIRKVGKGLKKADKWAKKVKSVSKIGKVISATGLGAHPIGQKALIEIDLGKQLGYG